MKQRRRIYYSAAQRAEIWDRWKAGESMSSIGVLVGVFGAFADGRHPASGSAAIGSGA